jgi:aspartyl-tRNA(Asn)/glutamyl-tRNA(Gln) amidotransferase subunit C
MKISREDVVRVAELAHLGLSPAEIDAYRDQLDAILTYVDKLKELDTSNVEPMAQVLHTAVSERGAELHPELREDVLVNCDTAKPILGQAPEAQAPFFRVPKVIER